MYKYIASKKFNKCVLTELTFYNGIFVTRDTHTTYTKTREEDVVLIKGLPKNVTSNKSNKHLHRSLKDNHFLSRVFYDKSTQDVVPLASFFGFELGKSINSDEDREFLTKALVLDNEATSWNWFTGNKDYLGDLTLSTFNSTNPKTGCKDVDGEEHNWVLPYIPLVVESGIIPLQCDDKGESYFNPNGTVTIGEFLDVLNSISYGSNSEVSRHTSLDNVCVDTDFFNMGYNACLDGFSSPFYRLYTRLELASPLTRCELAYILVCCWKPFKAKYGSINSGKYKLGVNTNWENPSLYYNKFYNFDSVKVTKRILDNFTSESDDNLYDTFTSINLKDYLEGDSMTSMLALIKSGEKGLPLPLFATMFEMDALDLFYFKDRELSPLKQVSRAELSYFAVKLAKEFSEKYINMGDNSY